MNNSNADNPIAFDREQFLKRFYPTDPFESGVWVEADKVPIEVFTACVAASTFLTNFGHTEETFKTILSKVLIRVDAKWYRLFVRRRAIVSGFIAAALDQKPGQTSVLLAKYRQQISGIDDDPQLHQDLIEAEESISHWQNHSN